MSNTFILECNRFNSKVKTDDKLDWINNIDALQLKAGDQVSMVKAILNKRGASTQTINFEEDVEEQILIGYYVSDSGITASNTLRSTVYDTGTYTTGASSRPADTGFTDAPFTRMVVSSDAMGRKLYPVIQFVSIKIGKGSYSVSALSDLITQQFSNGEFTEPFDYKIDNTLKTNLLTHGLAYNGKFMDRIYHETGAPNNDGTGDADLPVFVDGFSIHSWYEDYVAGFDDLTLLGNTANTIRDPAEASNWLAGFNAGTAGSFSMLESSYIGCSPYIEYNTLENRFQIQQLHMPYIIPSIDAPNTVDVQNTNIGSTATIFKMQHNTFDPDVSCNPRDSVGGCWILNPAFLTSQTNGDVLYTKNIAVIQAGKNKAEIVKLAIDTVAPFVPAVMSEEEKATASWVGMMNCDYDECFSTDTLAQKYWETTFWYRLGFKKEQFGSRNRLIYRFRSDHTFPVTTRGLTTINDYNITYAQSSAGTGEHPTTQHGHVVIGYGSDIPSSFTGAEPGVYSEWRQATKTKPLVAVSLPQLSSDVSYYNVYTDLVPNNWFTNSSQLSLVGNISFVYSEGDYVYSFDDNIVFELTTDRVVTEVKTSIVQSDGKIPPSEFFDPYTTIFYRIVRPTRSFTSNVLPIEAKAQGQGKTKIIK